MDLSVRLWFLSTWKCDDHQSSWHLLLDLACPNYVTKIQTIVQNFDFDFRSQNPAFILNMMLISFCAKHVLSQCMWFRFWSKIFSILLTSAFLLDLSTVYFYGKWNLKKMADFFFYCSSKNAIIINNIEV